MAQLKGLIGEWVRFPSLAQQLMDDPDKFLSGRNIKVADYACPPEVHEKLARMREFVDEDNAVCAAGEAKGLPLAELVKNQRRVVEKHLGKGFIAESIPFGILFKERPTVDPNNPLQMMITGTGSCTFCKDSDSPDVD